MTGPDPRRLNEQLIPQADALKSLASRCDAMCLTAGVQLGDAVPGLYELSSRFASLSDMLVNEGGAKPAQILNSVANDIMSIGTALGAEREALAALIKLNGILSQRIVGLAEDVRFLSAVVSNVKIEIASIEGDHRLEGFGDNLKQLAAKSETTVTAFQATHQTLIKQLQRTAMMQSGFVTSHGTKFSTASLEISSSLGAVSDRRKTVASIAGEIGEITKKIGTQIAQCVVALQIGDSTRQRLEHAGEGLAIAADVVVGLDPDGIPDGEGIDLDPLYRDLLATRICRLETIQTAEATTEFSAEVETVAYLIQQITDASVALNDKSRDLISGPRDGSRSFLTDLESKLAFAGNLIEECYKSRKLVDDTAEQVIASVVDLQNLAQRVSAMATDMMIIGTNAVVTSYRLGTKGIPLSVIAQHLRNHAVRVTDAVKLVSPALAKVLEAAQQFTSAREGQDASSMEGLATRITEALAAFRDGDSAVMDIRSRLDSEVSAVGGVLHQAGDALHDIDGIETELRTVAEAIEELTMTDPDDADATMCPALEGLLRRLYTMGSERVIHDAFFAGGSESGPASATEPADDASVWL